MEENSKLLLNFIMDETTVLCFTEREKLYKEKLVYYYTDIDALLNGIIVDNPEQDKEICTPLQTWRDIFVEDIKA